MGENYSNEVKEKVKKYKETDIEFLKPLSYLIERNNITEEEIKKEIIFGEKLNYVEKQKKPYGIRYALFFKYSNKKGRCYVIEFHKKIKIITIFPLGKKTLKKYKQKRFI